MTSISVVETVRRYMESGLTVIPVPRGAKSPVVKDWPHLRIGVADVSKHFEADCNIAMVNGVASGGVINVDLDSLESLPIAEIFLPQTELVHGRHSKGGSHWWYRCSGKIPENRKFIDPTTTNGKSVCLLELIANNRLTLLPPSTHPSGERYRWERNGKPAQVDATVLVTAVEKLAAATLLARHWLEGSRHECAMAVAGILLRAGWSEEETKTFIVAVATAANDEERRTRAFDVATTAKRLAGEQNTIGAPRLKALISPTVVDRVMEWLHIRATVPATSPVQAVVCTGVAVTRVFSEIKPECLKWLWPGRIPLGKLTLLIGDPGLGKSLATIDIATRVTRGLPFPDGQSCEPGAVIMASAEDDVGDTIRPRLDSAGADVGRVHALEGIRITLSDNSTTERPFELETGVAALENAIARIPGVRLIVIDPISAYLGGADSNANAEVRGLLSPLAALAAKHKVAVLCVTHLRKSSGAAVHRAIASIAFAAAARAVWAVAPDPAEADRRLLLAVKQNLAPNIGGMAFRVDTKSGLPRLEWELGPVSLSANDVLNIDNDGDRSERQDAEEWLRDYLADGPVGASEVIRAAKAVEIAKTTLGRAANCLGVVKRKLGGRGAGWEWSLKSSKNPTAVYTNVDSLDSLTNDLKTNPDSGVNISKNPPDENIDPLKSLIRDGSAVESLGSPMTAWVGPPPKPVSCVVCGQLQESALTLSHHLNKEHSQSAGGQQ